MANLLSRATAARKAESTAKRSTAAAGTMTPFVLIAGLALSPSGVSRRAIVSNAGAAAAVGVCLPALANSDPVLSAVSTQTGSAPDGGKDFVSLPSGVKIKDIRAGTGPQAQKGDTVSVQLSGRCLNLNGKKFTLDMYKKNCAYVQQYDALWPMLTSVWAWERTWMPLTVK